MWIVCYLADNAHEMSSLIFSEKKEHSDQGLYCLQLCHNIFDKLQEVKLFKVS